MPRTTGCAWSGGAAAADEHVVAMEGDVDGADVDLDARALGDERAQAVGERDAARVDADERERVEVGVALDQLVRDPGERPLERRGVEQNFRRLAARECVVIVLLSGLAGPV